MNNTPNTTEYVKRGNPTPTFCVLILIIWFIFLLTIMARDNTKQQPTCTTNLVTITDIQRTKAQFELTCTDSDGNIIINETLTDIQVGYIVHSENKRVLGMKKESLR